MLEANIIWISIFFRCLCFDIEYPDFHSIENRNLKYELFSRSTMTRQSMIRVVFGYNRKD